MNKIPKIIHRTVPENTTSLMDMCWNSAIENNKDWSFISHVSPETKNPYDFPITSKYWGMCKAPAYIADLIRLEVLYKFGGIYLDSDIFIYKNLSKLLFDKPFMAREDDYWICNAVIGSPPKHPAIFNLIEKTLEKLDSGEIAHGPFIATDCWSNRRDVIILNSEYFYSKRYSINNFPPKSKPIFGKHLGTASWVNIIKNEFPEDFKKLEYRWIKHK